MNQSGRLMRTMSCQGSWTSQDYSLLVRNTENCGIIISYYQDPMNSLVFANPPVILTIDYILFFRWVGSTTNSIRNDLGSYDDLSHACGAEDPLLISGANRRFWTLVFSGKRDGDGEVTRGVECLYLRIFQHTPGTYPRPPTNSLWRNSFCLGGFGIPGVCSKGMLGFS